MMIGVWYPTTLVMPYYNNYRNQGRGRPFNDRQPYDDRQNFDNRRRSYQKPRTYTCWTCGEPGHFAPECPTKPKNTTSSLKLENENLQSQLDLLMEKQKLRDLAIEEERIAKELKEKEEKDEERFQRLAKTITDAVTKSNPSFQTNQNMVECSNATNENTNLHDNMIDEFWSNQQNLNNKRKLNLSSPMNKKMPKFSPFEHNLELLNLREQNEQLRRLNQQNLQWLNKNHHEPKQLLFENPIANPALPTYSALLGRQLPQDQENERVNLQNKSLREENQKLMTQLLHEKQKGPNLEAENVVPDDVIWNKLEQNSIKEIMEEAEDEDKASLAARLIFWESFKDEPLKGLMWQTAMDKTRTLLKPHWINSKTGKLKTHKMEPIKQALHAANFPADQELPRKGIDRFTLLVKYKAILALLSAEE